ncbi:HNH endonuclease signature motif containing protein [Bacillus subtilis]
MIGGYLAVSLQHSGRALKRNVHLLVCAAFHGPRPDGKVARHLDGNPRNNRAANLTWGTQAENISDQVLHGTHPHARKAACPRNHPLEEPNLVPSAMRFAERRGGSHRACLACSRANSYVYYHKDLMPDLDRIADSYYERIIRDAETKAA